MRTAAARGLPQGRRCSAAAVCERRLLRRIGVAAWGVSRSNRVRGPRCRARAHRARPARWECSETAEGAAEVAQIWCARRRARSGQQQRSPPRNLPAPAAADSAACARPAVGSMVNAAAPAAAAPSTSRRLNPPGAGGASGIVCVSRVEEAGRAIVGSSRIHWSSVRSGRNRLATLLPESNIPCFLAG